MSSTCEIPPNSIYSESMQIDDERTLSVSICPLSYSFFEHRARYKVFFSVESGDDYGDGMAYLYEDDGTFAPTRFIDENISADIIDKVRDIALSAVFAPSDEELASYPYYLLPDNS